MNSEEKKLIIKAKGNDKEAKEKIITLNKNIIIKLAKYYKNKFPGMSLDDLIQDGYIGIINAINEFNIEKDNKFITYAFYHIKKMMINDIMHIYGAFKIPENIYRKNNKMFNKYRKAIEIYDESDTENILKYMNISQKELEEIKKPLYLYGVSLNYKIGSTEVVDFVIDNSNNVEDEVERKILNEELRTLIMNLLKDEKVQELIKARYGFDGEILSYDEISKKYNITSGYARKLVFETIKKLKKDSKILKEYYYDVNGDDYMPHQISSDDFSSLQTDNIKILTKK